MPAAVEAVDLARLHQYLRALANPARLELLWALREPQRPADVRVAASGEWSGLQPGRALSRSTTLEHLAVLEELGLVEAVPGQDRVVVNRQRMVALVQELGALAAIRPAVTLDVGRTVKAHRVRAEPMPRGPKLILVSGPEAGEAFALHGDGPWSVGRGRDAAVRIDFDPHASRVHARISRSEDGLHWVEALPGATNPALLDFRELAPARPEPLIPGSVLTVGSSRFVFKGV